MGPRYRPPIFVRRQSCWMKQNKIFNTHRAGLQLYDPCASWLQVSPPVVFCIPHHACSTRPVQFLLQTELLPLMDKFYCFEKHFAAEFFFHQITIAISSLIMLNHTNNKKPSKLKKWLLKV